MRETAIASVIGAAVVLLAVLTVYMRVFWEWPALRKVQVVLIPISQLMAALFFVATYIFDVPDFRLAFALTVLVLVCALIDMLIIRPMVSAGEARATALHDSVMQQQVEMQRARVRSLVSQLEEAERLRGELLTLLGNARELLGSLQRESETHSADAVGVSPVCVNEARVNALEACAGRIDCATRSRWGVRRFCKNAAVDALLAMRAQACEDAGVRFECAAMLPDTVAISDVDICAVLANLLDNAIKAAGEVAADSRENAADAFVLCKTRVEGGFLFVVVENSWTGEVPLPDRRDAHRLDGHGWGSDIVRTLVGRYHGSFDTECTDTTWKACAVLDTGG